MRGKVIMSESKECNSTPANNSDNIVDKLSKLSQLKESGAITPEEFANLKARLLSTAPPAIEATDMGIVDTRCPKCGKQSTEYAENKWKCLECGLKFIYEPPQPSPSPKFAGYSDNIKWYHRTSFVVISVLCLGLFALPLIWFNPNYSIASKVIWTIIVIAYMFLLFVGLPAILLKQIQ